MRDTGRTLDDARLVAAEAGYMNHLYGSPEEAMARSTVTDFLDLLDQDMRTGRVTADDIPADAADRVAAERASIQAEVETLQRAIGRAFPTRTSSRR